MDKNKDILTSSQELKTMPYDIPEGYLEQFKAQAVRHRTRPGGFIGKLSPILALAAMFSAIVVTGNLVMKHYGQDEGLTYEDYIVHSDIIVTEENPDISGTSIAQAEMTQEDIVRYLIYIGESAESIEENFQER